MTKGSRLVAWRMLKDTVLEVAPMPTKEPLSINLPLPKAELLVQMALRPGEPEPVVTPLVAKVIWPWVEVVMVMLEPATKLVGMYLVPVASAERSCPWVVGAVVVPVPPLLAAKLPVQPGRKVKVLAVVVLILMVMLVSVVVATEIAGPVKAEMLVKAEVR